MDRNSGIDAVAAWLAKSLPALVSAAEDAGRELIQTTVWLVGLATALLGLLFANPTLLSAVPQTRRGLLVVLLLSVVVLGVAQRVAFRFLEPRIRNFVFGLQGHLTGLTLDVEQPVDLSDFWDREELLARLKRDFDLDYARHIGETTPAEFLQKAYKTHFASWKGYEAKKAESLGLLVGAYAGIPVDRARGLLTSAELDSNYPAIRKAQRRLNRISIGIVLAFTVGAIAFVSALAIVGYAVVTRQP